MNETEKAYWAGLIDGEGSIVISKSRKDRRSLHLTHFIRVMIYNTSKSLIMQAQHDFGFGSITKNTTRNTSINGFPNRKESTVYSWHASCNQAEEALKMVLPYLRLKKPHVELALQFQIYKRKTALAGRVKGGAYPKMSEEVFQEREKFKTELSKLNNPSYDEA